MNQNERRAYLTGVFRSPKRRAAGIAVAAVREELKKQTSVKKVIFTVFRQQSEQIYREILERVRGTISSG